MTVEDVHILRLLTIMRPIRLKVGVMGRKIYVKSQTL